MNTNKRFKDAPLQAGTFGGNLVEWWMVKYGLDPKTLELSDETIRQYATRPAKTGCPQCPTNDSREWFTLYSDDVIFDVTLARALVNARAHALVETKVEYYNQADAEIFGLMWKPDAKRTGEATGYWPEEQHLSHISAESLDTPALFAPMPNSGLLVLIDGVHRGTERFRRGHKLNPFIALTREESIVSIQAAAQAQARILKVIQNRI